MRIRRDRNMIALAAVGAAVFSPVAMAVLILGGENDAGTTGPAGSVSVTPSPSSTPQAPAPPPTGAPGPEPQCYPFTPC